MVKESSYIRTIKSLINRIHDLSPVSDSVYEQATGYFEQAAIDQEKRSSLMLEIKASEKKLTESGSQSDKKLLSERIKVSQSQLKVFNKKLDEERLVRHRHLKQICVEIVDLIEGDDFADNNDKTARMLGTMLMITPESGRKVPQLNMFSKHMYKAALSVRLLDRLVFTQNIIDPHVTRFAVKDSEQSAIEPEDLTSQESFRQNVKIPLIMAALIQDIGRMHPDAQKLLKGEDGQADEFRVLERDDRNKLLKITFQQALSYFKNGIGTDKYTGNSLTEREEFNKLEKAKLEFGLKLLKSSLKPQNGIGNILKIPQVYASVVMSTKTNQPIAVMPKVGQMLRKGAEQGMFSPTVTEALLQVTGIFPQGYGIAFIPKDSDKRDIDKYEYAIVTRLYPANPDEPISRCVTRNLSYNSNCPDYVISKSNNLYFEPARKAFEKVSPERLLEILSKLVSNFEERKNQDLVPRCWHPYEYFSDAKHQNLWNKMSQFRN
ncbi:hypothetical protein [Neptunicella sp. SCSIO 80796]|uniref:hypothetical protein n=1 Tax=Neptunicella plasticusilytica TaxID=3117012 RepID=UPI003A4DA4AB